jgi:hypothetical protein
MPLVGESTKDVDSSASEKEWDCLRELHGFLKSLAGGQPTPPRQLLYLGFPQDEVFAALGGGGVF